MLRRPWFIVLSGITALLVMWATVLAYARLRSGASRLPERGAAEELLAGLESTVEVLLDARGIPHLRCAGERDLWFAQGYLHARDRFLQMELARRTAAGRLAEIFDEPALPEDRKHRIWRLDATSKRHLAQLPEPERDALESYAAGVNAALERYGRWIAPELWMLAVDPEPWRPEDSLATAVLVQFTLTSAMAAEVSRATELARLGRSAAVDLWGWSPDEARSWIPPVEPATTSAQEDDALEVGRPRAGSNCWAVAASKAALGRPLIANDVQLEPQLPGQWYAMHLRCPDLHVAGVSIPGMPGIVMGHTENVAWGLSLARADDQDLFVLELDPTRTRELVDGNWQPLRTVTEEIRVRTRAEPEILKIRLSERGTVVSDTNQQVLALQWAGWFGASPIVAVLRMDRARSLAEVVQAWQGVAGPTMSLVAADTGGRLAHHIVGLLPDRDLGAGRLPAPGAASRWSWHGFLPLAASPHRVDPPEGLVAVANQDLFSEGVFPGEEAFPGEFAAPWRARRIRSALAARNDWDVRGFVELQSDVVSGMATALLRQLRASLEEVGGPTAEQLLGWDGRMVADQLAPHVYSQLILDLGREIGGDEAFRSGLGTTPFDASRTLRLLAGGMSDAWWDDTRTQSVENRETIIRRALESTDRRRLSHAWGHRHVVRFDHPLTGVPLLGPLLGGAWSQGPLATAGDSDTVNANHWGERAPFAVGATPSLRMVTDVGAWDDAVLVLSLGQSGRPWSSHYADQLRSWLHGTEHRLAFSDAAVDAAARSRLTLLPASEPPRTANGG